MQKVVTRPTKLRGTVIPPGDKSISHRAAIFNALGEGHAVVTNFCPGEDGESTLRCLRSLGTQITQKDSTLWITSQPFVEPSNPLDARNSGTTMRLLAGVLAGQPFQSLITGDQSLLLRPMGRITEPLRLMGATIDGPNNGSLAPLSINGGNLHGIHYKLPVASAQVKSSIMLAALVASGETILEEPTQSRDHTERMFSAMGIKIDATGGKLALLPGRLQALDIAVPGDISSAAFWLVAAICHPDAEIRIEGVGINPSRTGVLDVLESMGADITIEKRRDQGGEPVADLIARSSVIRATTIEKSLIPRVIDEIPILALAACFAQGTTTIRDASDLRSKESDRLSTTAKELARLGASIDELPDGLSITGIERLNGAECQSSGDHRIAMMLGVGGLLSLGSTVIDDPAVASVSYPSFWTHLNDIASFGLTP